jgi:uncharacterized OB-fold protein
MPKVDRFIVHPEVDQDSAPYWESLKGHAAKIQRCSKCGRFRYPPSASCYYCGTPGGDWKAISGKGTIYSWIVIHHPIDPRLTMEVPFTLLMVELKEGPRLVGRLIGPKPQLLRVGMPVKVCYEDIDNQFTLLNFQLVS